MTRRLTAFIAAILLAATMTTLLAASTARAATASCGPSCVNPFFRLWGHRYIFDVKGGGFGTPNQPLILWRAASSQIAEDFTYSITDTVPNLVADGLLPHSDLIKFSGDTAFELEYSPAGLDSGLCMGTFANRVPQPGWRVRLAACGVNASTLWIVHNLGTGGNPPGFATIVSGITSTFSQFLVLSYPPDATPGDFPRPNITVQRLITFSNGTHPSAQQVSATFGPIP